VTRDPRPVNSFLCGRKESPYKQMVGFTWVSHPDRETGSGGHYFKEKTPSGVHSTSAGRQDCKHETINRLRVTQYWQNWLKSMNSGKDVTVVEATGRRISAVQA